MEDFKKFNLMKDEPTTASGGTEQDAAHSFTDGQWKVWFDDEIDTYCISSEKQTSPGVPELDIWVGRSETPLEIRKCNAELIASLPNMLSELTRLRSELQQERELRKELVEAVQKLISNGSFRSGYPYTTKVFESIIEKAKLNN